MTHPCVAKVAESVLVLRQSDLTGAIEENTHIVPEVYFSADSANGTAAVELLPRQDALLKVRVTVTGLPDWLTFNIGMGEGRFQPRDTLGVVAEVSTDLKAESDFRATPFIRSDQMGDTHFAAGFALSTEAQPASLLHPVTSADALTYGSVYHTLVLPLPKRTMTLTVHALRLIHMDASEGLSAEMAKLGCFAV